MSSPRPIVYQLNLSPSLGGAEVYTAFFARALLACGWPTEVVVAREAEFWRRLDCGGAKLSPFVGNEQLLAAFPAGAIVVVHSPAPEPLIRRLAQSTRLLALCHQALYSVAQPNYYRHAELLIPVSHYAVETLRRRGYRNIYSAPLYGLGQVAGNGEGRVVRGDLVDWDGRKARDRLLAGIDTLLARFRPTVRYVKRQGLTLGIVSRLAGLKQFPELLRHIAPQLAARPDVWLEVFGRAVGYRALRDFRQAAAPLGARVRYWGHQQDVLPVYRSIDFLLTGLPERESLGLNVIEAQMCGTPVLAPAAPPFTETVIDGGGGFLYRDPRQDGGADFGRVLDLALTPGARPDLRQQREHLAQFEFPAFRNRVDLLMKTVCGE